MGLEQGPVLDDTNCNVIGNETIASSSHVQALEDTSQQFGFSQIIREATRVPQSTSTLVDHIAVSNKLVWLKLSLVTII